MIVSKYSTFNGESYVDATTYDKVLYELKAANEEKYRLTNKLKKVEKENKVLKQRIKDLEDACDESCFHDKEDDRDKLIAGLQDQYQQDCIKINQLHVTIDTLVDKYSRLRKTVGMD